MSRRGVRGPNVSTQLQKEFSVHKIPSTSRQSRFSLRSRDVYRQIGDFSDGSDTEEVVTRRTTKQSRMSSTKATNGRHNNTKTTFNTSTTHSLLYGLDAESDADDGSGGLWMMNRATPLFRRSTSPLVTVASLPNHNLRNTDITHANNSNAHLFQTAESVPWYSYVHIKHIFTVFCASIMLATISVFNLIFNFIQNYSIQSLYSIFKNSINVVMNSVAIVVSFISKDVLRIGKLRLWYGEKRRDSSCLWMWLLLLLVVCFALSFTGFLLNETQRSEVGGIVSGKEVSYKGLKDVLFESYFSFLEFTAKMLGAVWSALQIILDYMLMCLQSLYVTLINSMQNISSFIKNNFNSFLVLMRSSVHNSPEISKIVIHNSKWRVGYEWVETCWHLILDVIIACGTQFVSFCSFVLSVFSLSIAFVCNVVGYVLWWLWVGLTWVLWLFAASLTDLTNATLNTVTIAALNIKNFFVGMSIINAPIAERENIDADLVHHANNINIDPKLSVTHDAEPVSELVIASIVSRIVGSRQWENVIKDEIKQEIYGQHRDKEKQLSSKPLDHIIKSSLDVELALFRKETTSQTKLLLQETQGIQQQQFIQLQQQQQLLIAQMKEMWDAVKSSTKANEADSNNVQKLNQENVKNMVLLSQINKSIKKMEGDHLSLVSEVGVCCKKATLTLADVENHMMTLLSSASVGTEAQFKSQDFGTWLQTNFIAKDELETKLNELPVSRQTQIRDKDGNIMQHNIQQETVTQSGQLVMDNIVKKLEMEIRKEIERSKEVHEMQKATLQALIKNTETALMQQAAELKLQFQMQVKEESLHSLQQEIKLQVQEAIASATPDVAGTKVALHLEKQLVEGLQEIMQKQENTLGALQNTLQKQVYDSMHHDVQLLVADGIKAAAEELKEILQSNENDGALTSDDSKQSYYHTVNPGTNIFASMISSNVLSALNESQVEQIVSQALKKYDADKTGMVDHALESGGGSVVSTRCTETYQVHQAELVIFGYSFYRFSTNTPRSVIQPDRNPGQCWAFKGSQGFIVIQLARPVRLTGFTLEHIPKSLSPTGSIDSSPREFTVYGLNEPQEEGVLIGSYTYMEDSDPLQYFPAHNRTNEFFTHVELKVLSNHGNLKYTCIYRFRVHGVVVNY